VLLGCLQQSVSRFIRTVAAFTTLERVHLASMEKAEQATEDACSKHMQSA
jgi:hypothetical protein